MGGTASRNKYNAKAYDRIDFVVKKGRKEEIQKAADAMGESLNKFIATAVYERWKRFPQQLRQQNSKEPAPQKMRDWLFCVFSLAKGPGALSI